MTAAAQMFALRVAVTVVAVMAAVFVVARVIDSRYSLRVSGKIVEIEMRPEQPPHAQAQLLPPSTASTP